MSRYTTIEDIIQHVIGEEALDARSAGRLVPMAVRGWNVINREATNDVITRILEFDNANVRVIDYPFDYDYYTKLGIIVTAQNGTKKVMTLSLNRYMYKPTDGDITQAQCTCANGTLQEDMQNISFGAMPYNYFTVFQNSWRGGQYVGELFGIGGGESAAGSFTPDDQNARFVFSNDIPTTAKIVLEYKQVATANGSNTRIPIFATEAMIAWVKWKMLNRMNSGIGERREAQLRYEEEVYKLYEQQESLTKSEILDELYESQAYINN